MVLWQIHAAIGRGAPEATALTIAAASVALLAFALLTRMHERYMFLALVVFAPVIFLRPLRIVYAALSALFLLDLWAPYAFYNTVWWHVQGFHYNPWFDWLLGGFVTDTWQKKVWSALVTAIALVVAWRGARWAGTFAPLQEALAAPAPATAAPAAPAPSVRAPAARITRSQPPPGMASRWGPLTLLGLTCLFLLAILRGETAKAVNLNDSSFHLQMVRWAGGQIREGRVPFDGWYPYLTAGSSFFHHYQSLPHTLTAAIARFSGAGDQTTYLWILYLLLALWPIAIYVSARLLGWGRWTAAAAAAVSPLIVSASGYGYEHGSYTWRGYGVYSQLWGMWMLPLAWGTTWRAVTRGKYYVAATAALALTMAFHFITGYLAVLTVGVWVLVAGSGYLVRAGRAAVVVIGSVLVASWVLVPLIGDTKWTTRSEFYTGSVYNDSYGAHKILAWLFTGDLFDSGRFPIVSLLFALGVGVCAVQARWDIRARALLGVFGFSLVLFFGRKTLGRRHGRPPRHPGHPGPSLRDGSPPLGDPDRRRRARVAAPARVHHRRQALDAPPGPPRRSLGGGACRARVGAGVDGACGTTTRRVRRSFAGSRWPMRPTAATWNGSSRS